MYLFDQLDQSFFFFSFTFRQDETTCWGRGRRQVCVHGCSLSYNPLNVHIFFQAVLSVNGHSCKSLCFHLSRAVFWSVGSGAVGAESSWVSSNPWLMAWSLDWALSLTVVAALELEASILSYGSDVHWERKQNGVKMFDTSAQMVFFYVRSF